MNNTNKIISSSRLYSDPSFIKGMARVVDFFGQLDTYAVKPSEREADETALKRDWQIVGRDITRAMNTYGKTQKAEK